MLFELAWTDTSTKRKCRLYPFARNPARLVPVKPSLQNPTPPLSLLRFITIKSPVKTPLCKQIGEERRRGGRMRGSKEDRSPAEQMFLGGLKWGSKLENRNAPSGDPPPSKETYSLRVETDGGGSDSWKGGELCTRNERPMSLGGSIRFHLDRN